MTKEETLDKLKKVIINLLKAEAIHPSDNNLLMKLYHNNGYNTCIEDVIALIEMMKDDQTRIV